MAQSRSQTELDQAWHIHTDRQLAAAKAGVTAVSVLNSGSWVALLSQADKVAQLDAGAGASGIFLAWGGGALLGTLPWVFIYLNTVLLGEHDYRRSSALIGYGLIVTRFFGLCCVLGSLLCFGWGVFELAGLFAGE